MASTHSPARKIGTIYARYSSRFQHSIEDQVRTCKEWADNNGIAVPDDMIFVDRAVTGKSARRQGLKDFRRALAENRADVAILFSTNRLFRKTYQSLAFVEEEIVDRGKRAVFVRSNLDTDETDHWRQLLHVHALMDEFVIQTTAEHVRAAHEGLLLQTRVFGSLAYGYAGEPIPGQTTRLGRPAKRLAIEPGTAEWVRKIFDWFVIEHLSIQDIIRRLNASEAPLPPRSVAHRWTRQVVRRMLANPRYRGLWEYGQTKVVWINKPGYARHVARDKPLASVQIESLRIVSDTTWYAAQERLANSSRNAGRKSKDGDRKSRPRVLNGLLFCAAHHDALEVAGVNGRYMFCPTCRDAAEPALFSQLPRRLTLELICHRLAELILADESLVERTGDQCRNHLQTLTQPDPQLSVTLRRAEDRLTNQINFILDAPGDSQQDQQENRERLARLRAERAEIQRRLAELEEAARNPAKLPEPDEIKASASDLATVLREAYQSNDQRELAVLHDVLTDLTGGHIELTQQGERKHAKGWLRATFRIRLLDTMTRRAGFPVTEEDGIEVSVDLKRPPREEALCEEAKQLYDAGLLRKEIAARLNCCPSYVTKLLKYWVAKHGQPLPDGRKRLATLPRKRRETPRYAQLAEPAKALWDPPSRLSVEEIARQFETTDRTIWNAIKYAYRVRDLPVPSATQRSEQIQQRARQLSDEGINVPTIATMLRYSRNGIRKLLRASYASTGDTMPDGRSRRPNRKVAS